MTLVPLVGLRIKCDEPLWSSDDEAVNLVAILRRDNGLGHPLLKVTPSMPSLTAVSSKRKK
jgi:hypothetical protein